MLTYSTLTIFLFAAINIYFIIANMYNIIDKPNQRSSHTSVTIRGGGIVTLIGFWCADIIGGFKYPLLTASLTIISVISFIDDIRSLSNKTRILFHIISVYLLLQNFCPLPFGIFGYLFFMVIVIGILNAYNFMDGINGMNGLYSLSILIPIYFYNASDKIISEVYLTSAIVGILVFGYYNFRNKPKCFAGDVGSMSIAIFIVFILLKVFNDTKNPAVISMLLVYGVDTIFTILERAYNNENIFVAHRKHLYQLLSNEGKVPHLLVSSIYSIVQLVINIILLKNISNFNFCCMFILSTLFIITIIYFILKHKIKNEAFDK